ncbi:MAG: dynamin family protein, partial [Usitatibacteraceae bacterium]
MTNAAITKRLAELQSWRYDLNAQLSRVLDFLRTHEFLTAETALAINEAKKRVVSERVTISFVGEPSRGKSELINGLFFANLGRELLPSNEERSTRCVTELRFDRAHNTGLRLLPIETRESPKRLAEWAEDVEQWRLIPFEADNPDSMANALVALTETKRISLNDAVAWGLHGEGVAVKDGDIAMVDVPRWRYAIINFPHPLLDAGLVIIDTPSLSSLSLEPELNRERLPTTDALVLVLDITEGVTKTDQAFWRDHPGAVRNFRERAKDAEPDESVQVRLVVLNKIDALEVSPRADSLEANREFLREIDRRARETADLLRVDPMRVIAVSARQGLAGKLANDNDQFIKSRLYQLEQNLGANLPRNRQA